MNTGNKIIVKENKVLKLSNVLIREMTGNELSETDKISYLMDSYIKSKGNTKVGPLISYSSLKMDDKQTPVIVIKFMIQLANPLYGVDSPYKFKPQIRITNCLFARYFEKEQNLQFGYSKLNLYAFENDIKLKGDSYTVFVDRNEDKITADIFMEVQ